jgi:Berberine and berberine like
MKLGAGVLAAEAQLAAYKSGFRVIAGTCPTVGLAGGYTQGAGHSLLSSINGMGADNALEWEVVTAKGDYLIATPTQNSDLYWALSGGGGGTYGVVISLTTKLHPEGQVGGAAFSFNSSGIGLDAFWKAVDVFQASLPAIVDDGSTFLYQLTNSSLTAFSVTSPNRTKEQVTTLLTPLMSALGFRNISCSYNPTSYSSFYEHFDAYYGPLPLGSFPVSQVTSSRLLPRSVVTNNTARVGRTFRNITANGNFYLGCTALNAARADGVLPSAGRNAVLPAWRSALLHCITVGPWDPSRPESELLALQAELTESVSPQLQTLASVSDGGGIYLNEANFAQQGWQTEFYGANYKRLRKIKRDYDPKDLLYAITAVGSEAWVPDEEGRLCRA